MVGVVRDHDHGLAHAREHAHPRQHQLLVAEVERRRGLVHDQHVGLLRERAGDQDQLLLAARQVRIGLLGQSHDPQKLERLIGDLPVARSGLRQLVDVGRASHEHHVGHREREGRRVRLRDVGEVPCPLMLGHAGKRLSLYQHLPARTGQKPHHGFQRGGLAAAVRADDAHELAAVDGKRHPMDDLDRLLLAVSASKVADLKHRHQRHPFILCLKMTTKNGTPRMAVRMPMGTSTVMARRAMLSTSSRYTAPTTIEHGSSTL